MLDLSSIQDEYLSEYLSLDHLRAFIYKSKLEKGKNKGRNEEAFYGVTCAQDVLALLKKEESSNNIPNCYLLNPVTGVVTQVGFQLLTSYLSHLIHLAIDTEDNKFRYNPAVQAEHDSHLKNDTTEFWNMDFYFRRDEIEKIIGAKIPYFKNLPDIVDIHLTPFQDETEINDNPQVEYNTSLPEGINADKLAEFIELVIDPSLLDEDGKMPTYSRLHSRLNTRYRTGKNIPSKNTIKKYLNQ